MELQRKALYNLLKINRMPGSESTLLNGKTVEPWQLQNYRELADRELTHRLHELNICLKITDFEAYAKNYDSPEEMADSLAGDLDHREQDKAYLAIFELWRRFLPEKQAISIFCDELDHQILAYDQGETKDPSDIQDALAYLQNLLDEYVDNGAEPNEAFLAMQNYSANDIESFLYDYILEEIEAGNKAYATELLDGFSRYVSNPTWFDFLRVRVEISEENDEALQQLDHFIEDLIHDSQLHLNLEVLHFLAKRRDRQNYISLALASLNLIDYEDDFQDFLAICQTLFHEIDRNHDEKAVQEMLQKRAKRKLEDSVSKNDPHFIIIKDLIHKSVMV